MDKEYKSIEEIWKRLFALKDQKQKSIHALARFIEERGAKKVRNIFVHGLGQNETSWNMVETRLLTHDIKIEKPNLYSMLKGQKADYNTLLQIFMDYCNGFDDQLNVCGLSLGGILALDYAKRFPNHINSIILIGTPYEIPRFLFRLQGILFHFMPKTAFESLGCSKKDFISLVNSMGDLKISHGLDDIHSKTLILCGAKDRPNIDSARQLNRQIKGSQLGFIENASHEINVDNPDELSRRIFQFFTIQNG